MLKTEGVNNENELVEEEWVHALVGTWAPGIIYMSPSVCILTQFGQLY